MCAINGNWYASDEPIRLCCTLTQDEITVHEDELHRYEPDLDYTPADWVTYPVYQTTEGA
jgi:hypothetical protein